MLTNSLDGLLRHLPPQCPTDFFVRFSSFMRIWKSNDLYSWQYFCYFHIKGRNLRNPVNWLKATPAELQIILKWVNSAVELLIFICSYLTAKLFITQECKKGRLRKPTSSLQQDRRASWWNNMSKLSKVRKIPEFFAEPDRKGFDGQNPLICNCMQHMYPNSRQHPQASP